MEYTVERRDVVRGHNHAKGAHEHLKLVRLADGRRVIGVTFRAYEGTYDGRPSPDGWNGYAWVTTYDVAGAWAPPEMPWVTVDAAQEYESRLWYAGRDMAEASRCHCLQCTTYGGDCVYAEPEEYPCVDCAGIGSHTLDCPELARLVAGGVARVVDGVVEWAHGACGEFHGEEDPCPSARRVERDADDLPF